jgi:hypothetical protein
VKRFFEKSSLRIGMNFRDADGAFRYSLQRRRENMEVRFDNVIYNPGLSDSLFAAPTPGSK